MGGVLIFGGHLFVIMAKGVGAYFGRVFMRAWVLIQGNVVCKSKI